MVENILFDFLFGGIKKNTFAREKMKVKKT